MVEQPQRHERPTGMCAQNVESDHGFRNDGNLWAQMMLQHQFQM